MPDRFEPASDFLKAIIAGEVAISGDEWAAQNLQRLVDMMRDADRTNRDWATFLLARDEIDTSSVRAALLVAVSDDDAVVRAEAMLGLAQRDVRLALPFVQEALRANTVAIPTLEAAAICADPSLVPDLRIWAEPSGEPLADQAAAEALSACERGTAIAL